eukprot:scaffold58921_cov58-Phaeocystis_antarctica.AAC.1
MLTGVDACVRRGQARAACGCVVCACVDVCARRGTVRHVAAARTWCASQLVASGVVQQDDQWQPAAGAHTEPRSSSLLLWCTLHLSAPQ